jgi:tetratricopeptide (TPR) repeat protein
MKKLSVFLCSGFLALPVSLPLFLPVFLPLTLSVSSILASELKLDTAPLVSNDIPTKLRQQRQEVDRLLGPLVLTAELSADSLQLLLDEAERHYRLGKKDDALDEYAAILALAPKNGTAWLRMGNLYHQEGRESEAIEAYQKAASFAAAETSDRVIRDKALLNISMIYLAKAGDALTELERSSTDQPVQLPEDVSDKARSEVHLQLVLRQSAQDTDARVQVQANRLQSSAKRSRAVIASKKPS